MITVTHQTPARPEQIWAVLADGWTYAAWVVGACGSARWRAAGDAGQPHPPLGRDVAAAGQRRDRGRGLRARAADPAEGQGQGHGAAIVEIRLHDEGDRTRIEMREDATAGLGKLLPHTVRQALIAPRNTETVTRLALLAERRTQPTI